MKMMMLMLLVLVLVINNDNKCQFDQFVVHLSAYVWRRAMNYPYGSVYSYGTLLLACSSLCAAYRFRKKRNIDLCTGWWFQPDLLVGTIIPNIGGKMLQTTNHMYLWLCSSSLGSNMSCATASPFHKNSAENWAHEAILQGCVVPPRVALPE